MKTLHSTLTTMFLPKCKGFGIGDMPLHIAQEMANDAIEETAKWIETQRNDIPATGEEFAAAIREL